MKNFGLAIILLACFTVVEVAMVTMDKDNFAYKSGASPNYRTSAEDLYYSDDIAEVLEKRGNLFKKLRGAGVPSDVINQMYPQHRGMTIGDLTGKGHQEHHSSGDDDTETSTFDPWTIVWYIGSFGGLIAFFLVVSCSEWCCLRNRRQNQQPQPSANTSVCPAGGVERIRATARTSCETPPPSYHLFAPPSYDDSINYEEKTKYDIFVVPVHQVGREIPPPEYSTVTMPPT